MEPLKTVYVNNGYKEGSNNSVRNRPEAERIVDTIEELCGEQAYKKKSMGVIILQGEAQARLIEELLLERIGAGEMNARRLICGNPYSFQGDERDIIFLSMVAAKQSAIGNATIGTMTGGNYPRRFNVAASRAKDQMWLFHSVRREDLGPNCLRRRLLDYFHHNHQNQIAGIDQEVLEQIVYTADRSIIDPPQPFDSWFEVEVALEILRKGYQVISQHEIANKRIDLVVVGAQSQLAVECDGDYWHGIDQFEEDMQRQRMLERCGWEFFRIRASQFYTSKSAILDKLWAKLDEKQIHPITINYASQDDPTVEEEIPEANVNNDYEDNDFNDEPEEQDENDQEAVVNDNTEQESNADNIRVEVISTADIREAIKTALKKRPKNACVFDHLTKYVLKEFNIITRGRPREQFDKKVKSQANYLEKKNIVKIYVATNKRIKLIN